MRWLPRWTGRDSRASAVPLAGCRILFGLCLIFDITSLIEYSPMWFDPVPYVDPAPAWVVPLLSVWLVAAIGLTLGAWSRVSAFANYVGCVVFMGFHSMPASCEFHPDALYLLTSAGLPFLPIGRVWSVDAWRKPPACRSIGPGAEIFFALVVSSIYLDSAVWKLSSSMWASGLGDWTPATQPWPGQPSFTWTLEHEWLARTVGYAVLAFELLFVVLVWFRPLRWLLVAFGLTLHVGIGTIMPLPLFGLIMAALLCPLLPLRAPEEAAAEAPPRPSIGQRVAPYFYGLWAAVFSIGLVDPLLALAHVGVGGSHGVQHRMWYSAGDTPLRHAAATGLFWAYRLFGFRTHNIFLDDQFARYDVQTRLRYFPPGAAELPEQIFDLADEGQDFFPPAYNRRFKAWHYRTVYAFFSLQRAEARLQRWLAFHAGRGDIDPASGWVAVEQRPILMPVDGWCAGQRAKNVTTAWRRVGVAHGRPGALEFRWRDPCWRPD